MRIEAKGHRYSVRQVHRHLCRQLQEQAIPPSIHTITFGRTAPCLPVREIQAAYAFYTDVLGFRKTFENGDPVGFMVLRKDAAGIHLSQRRNAEVTTVNALHMFVDDVGALCDRCQSGGVRIIKALRDKGYGQRAFVFADLAGNRIDVAERT